MEGVGFNCSTRCEGDGAAPEEAEAAVACAAVVVAAGMLSWIMASPRGGAVSGGARNRGVGYLAPPSSTLGGRLGRGVSLGGRAGPGGQAGRGAGHGVGRGEVTAGRRRRGVARARVPYIVRAIVEGNHSLPWRISCMILKDSLSGNGRPAFSARSVAATTCFINPSGIR